MQDFAQRTRAFDLSTIDTMSSICIEHKGLMLAGGTPGFDVPEKLSQLATKYINSAHNQYTLNRGTKKLRAAISEHWQSQLSRFPHIDDEITVTCGATEALLATVMACVDVGDRVIIFEPFYENFKNTVLLAGGIPDFVPLIPPNWEIDWDVFRAKAPGAKLIIFNSPHNPTGAVFDEQTLVNIADIAIRNNLFVLSDETYRHMSYISEPRSIAAIDGMAPRTAVVSSFSKTMTATGWRVGYVVASKNFTVAIRKVHDFTSICAPAPFQDAVADFWLSDDFAIYFAQLLNGYAERRTIFCQALADFGFEFAQPAGAYYVLADFTHKFPCFNDLDAVNFMASRVGVCGVGGRAFFADSSKAARYMRFSFARTNSEIHEAARRLHAFVS